MNITTTWNRDELEGYLFIYVANINFHETYEERALIGTKIDAETSAKLHREFAKDNDHQSINKIQEALTRLAYTHDEKKHLIEEVKNLLLADGEFDGAEHSMFVALKRIII